MLAADRSAMADLREATLAPFAELPEAAAERLSETLRAWLLLQGRRELVAEALHVQPCLGPCPLGPRRELLPYARIADRDIEDDIGMRS